MPPFVTVVLPVYNESAWIERSLGAILAQDYPAASMEVLVVDGLSTDSTPAQVQAIAARDPRVRLLYNPRRIQAISMNRAVAEARGEFIIRVDGHTLIAPDYVSRCIHHLQATGADNVGGPQRFVGITATGKAIAAAYRSPFSVPSRFTVSDTAEYVDTVYLGAWPRAVFDRIGGFDELKINEDYLFNYRIRKAGGRIYLSPDIRSDYYGRQTFSALARQFFNYGIGKFGVLAAHPASTHPRHLIAPVFVAALVGGALLAPFSRIISILWKLTLISYALANAVATIHQCRRAGWQHLTRLPLVFTTVHIAWGSGFWYGAWNMLRKHKL